MTIINVPVGDSLVPIEPFLAIRYGHEVVVMLDTEKGREWARRTLALGPVVSRIVARELLASDEAHAVTLTPTEVIGAIHVIRDHPLLTQMPEDAWVGFDPTIPEAEGVPTMPTSENFEALRSEWSAPSAA